MSAVAAAGSVGRQRGADAPAGFRAAARRRSRRPSDAERDAVPRLLSRATADLPPSELWERPTEAPSSAGDEEMEGQVGGSAAGVVGLYSDPAALVAHRDPPRHHARAVG